jgi:hypothetical protein
VADSQAAHTCGGAAVVDSSADVARACTVVDEDWVEALERSERWMDWRLEAPSETGHTYTTEAI